MAGDVLQRAQLLRPCSLHWPTFLNPLHQHRARPLPVRRRCAARAQSQPDSSDAHAAPVDTNQLQTRLNIAIAAENYSEAAAIRDQLQRLGGADARAVLDWRELGVVDWLAQRAEQLGYNYPTQVQRETLRAINSGQDVIVHAQTGSGKTLSYLLPLLTSLDYPPHTYPDDLKGPQLLVLVPTRELGVQQALLVYQLLGGSLNRGIPGNRANIFTYTGPRGIQVKGLLDKEEVLLAKNAGSLRGAHVVIGTPDAVAEAVSAPDAVPVLGSLKCLAVDEADACLQDSPAAMELVMTKACCQPQQKKPQVAFAGATVNVDACELAAQMGWLHKPTTVTVSPSTNMPLSVSHRFIATSPERKLAVLTRQIRADLEMQGSDMGPPRVMVFAENEEAAVAAAEPLRAALWGDHKLAVLLPHGLEPIQAMHAFRDNRATFLLATPAAARGLDLPAVSHVYNLSPPADAVEYLHRAGRVGRIGAETPGTVTTLVTSEEQPQLESIAEELQLDIQQQQEPIFTPASADDDAELAKRDLEDLYRLF